MMILNVNFAGFDAACSAQRSNLKKILARALVNLKKSKKKKSLNFLFQKQKTQYEQRNREKSENHIGTVRTQNGHSTLCVDIMERKTTFTAAVLLTNVVLV